MRGGAYLTKTEVERLFIVISAANSRDRLLFDVIYRYGLRRLEAALIRREHLSDGRVWVPRLKGGVSGEYPIHPATRKLLWTYLADIGDDGRPCLFVTRQSDIWPTSASTIYQLFSKYAHAADLPQDRRHPHVFRHSIAVHLMNAGWDVADVQDWLGTEILRRRWSTRRLRTNEGRRSMKKLFALIRSQITSVDPFTQSVN